MIEPLLPPLIDKGWSAPCRWHRRDVADAIFYVIKTGCSWRDLPGDFLVEQLGVARIQSLAEEILPGITDEIRGSPSRGDV